MNMNRTSVLELIACLVLVFGVAAIASRFTPGPWYAQLAKPAWNPPAWLFAPVWTFLYAAMAFAAWVVWRQAGWPAAAFPLGLFLVQLALNGAWSWIFFGLHRPGLALIEISALWVAVLATLIPFGQISTAAGALFIPYLAWVTFAAVLNAALWRLNP
jgi:translocator protein